MSSSSSGHSKSNLNFPRGKVLDGTHTNSSSDLDQTPWWTQAGIWNIFKNNVAHHNFFYYGLCYSKICIFSHKSNNILRGEQHKHHQRFRLPDHKSSTAWAEVPEQEAAFSSTTKAQGFVYTTQYEIILVGFHSAFEITFHLLLHNIVKIYFVSVSWREFFKKSLHDQYYNLPFLLFWFSFKFGL